MPILNQDELFALAKKLEEGRSENETHDKRLYDLYKPARERDRYNARMKEKEKGWLAKSPTRKTKKSPSKSRPKSPTRKTKKSPDRYKAKSPRDRYIARMKQKGWLAKSPTRKTKKSPDQPVTKGTVYKEKLTSNKPKSPSKSPTRKTKKSPDRSTTKETVYKAKSPRRKPKSPTQKSPDEPATNLQPVLLNKARGFVGNYLGGIYGYIPGDLRPEDLSEHDESVNRIITNVPKAEIQKRIGQLCAISKQRRTEQKLGFNQGDHVKFIAKGWDAISAMRTDQLNVKRDHLDLEKTHKLVSNAELRPGNPTCASNWGALYKGKTISGSV